MFTTPDDLRNQAKTIKHFKTVDMNYLIKCDTKCKADSRFRKLQMSAKNSFHLRHNKLTDSLSLGKNPKTHVWAPEKL